MLIRDRDRHRSALSGVWRVAGLSARGVRLWPSRPRQFHIKLMQHYL
jgi:hypothetical protein